MGKYYCITPVDTGKFLIKYITPDKMLKKFMISQSNLPSSFLFLKTIKTKADTNLSNAYNLEYTY